MSNPVLNKVTNHTYQSTVNSVNLESILQKITLLTLLTSLTTFISWRQNNPTYLNLAILILPILLITAFKPKTANFLSIPYSILQGLVLGTFARQLENSYPNIAKTALTITTLTLLTLLYAYLKKSLRLSTRFKKSLIIATASIAIYYILALATYFINALTGSDINLPLIQSNSIFGILFTLFIAVIAALNFLIDFENIETAISQKAPKDIEWALALGLLVTFVWLYIEILRLLAKLNRD